MPTCAVPTSSTWRGSRKIHFVANTYENVDNDGSYELYGDLIIKGITKRIKLEVEFGGVVKIPGK